MITPEPEPEIKIHVDPKYPPLPISRPLKILRDVAERHGVTVGDIKGVSRKIKFVRARQEACYLLREELKLSYPRIGLHLGNKDHTTILHGIRKYKKTHLKEAG
jgi:chromosomal replication initiator protein